VQHGAALGAIDGFAGQHRVALREHAAIRGQLQQQAAGGLAPAVLRQIGAQAGRGEREA
jgi:hypothetical protein